MAVLAAREADPDEPDFDRKRELAALVDAGYIVELPIVTAARWVARMLVNIGWEATVALGRGTWRGWQAEFLVDALVILAEYERRVSMIGHPASWRGASPKRDDPNG